LIVTHSPEHAFPVLDLIRRKPLVVHFHGPRALEYIAEGRSFRRVAMARLAETFTYARADRFVVLSEAFADILCKQYHVSRNRVRVVPGAVDVQRFRPQLTRQQARARLGWPADRPTVVAVRRLAATKGLQNLIDSIALVKERVPNVIVALVGGGPLRAALESRVASLGLADHVRFEGLMAEELLAHAYRAADVTIVPSVQLEGFGLSVVESLACGTPALVTPVAGLPEVVRDLDERLILSGTTPADLASGLVAALSHPERLPSEEACLAYVQRFAWTSIAARIKAVYEDVLDNAR
jgi:glycosyltransferase involved in cell wall biosynthesis